MKASSLLDNAPRVLAHVRGALGQEELDFWERLRFALRARGHELMLIAHHCPQEQADLPILHARSGLNSVVNPSPEKGWSGWTAPKPAAELAPYLEREALWNGPTQDEVEARERLEAADFFWRFYSQALAQAQPVLTLIWNGHHPQEMILRDLCRHCGCPVHFFERAPVYGALHVDADDILAASAVARSTQWGWDSVKEQERWRAVAKEVRENKTDAGQTWWRQPKRQDTRALRHRLGIKDNQCVVLYAGQVDKDTQNLLFSPHFKDGLEALEWFCRQMPHDGSVYVLGKHHPMSPIPAAPYQRAVGSLGSWSEDISLDDAFALCDRAAGVNSTVLFEALMREKPVLMLGQSLLSGKEIAYELKTLDSGPDEVQAWLEAADIQERLERLEDLLAYMLAHCFYTTQPKGESLGQRGAEDLADYCRAQAVSPEQTDYEKLAPVAPFLDEIGLWDAMRDRFGEYTGKKELLRGLNIICKASLGRSCPKTYNAILRLANRCYKISGARDQRK